jgi:hypothetical protein
MWWVAPSWSPEIVSTRVASPLASIRTPPVAWRLRPVLAGV